MKKQTMFILAGAALLFVSVGFNALFPPPSPAELRAYMASDEYKAQERDHFAKLARWEAERDKREAAR